MYVIRNSQAIDTSFLPRAEALRLLEDADQVFGSMAGAVYYGGVTATPFDRAVSEEILYDSRKALGINGPKSMEEVGRRAAYRVVIPGGSQIPRDRVRHDPVGGDLPPDERLVCR